MSSETHVWSAGRIKSVCHYVCLSHGTHGVFLKTSFQHCFLDEAAENSNCPGSKGLRDTSLPAQYGTPQFSAPSTHLLSPGWLPQATLTCSALQWALGHTQRARKRSPQHQYQPRTILVCSPRITSSARRPPKGPCSLGTHGMLEPP